MPPRTGRNHREWCEFRRNISFAHILSGAEAWVNTGEPQCMPGGLRQQVNRAESLRRDQSSSLLDLLGLSLTCLRELSGLIPMGLPSLTAVTEASGSGLK